MYRKELSNLTKWKDKKGRKPLIVNGARQVGKTWLLKEFGEMHFEKLAYMNLESNRTIETAFEGDISITRIITAIEIETGVSIRPGETLLVLDEIQTMPNALLALKYFYEQLPELHVACAGSLLGLALGQKSSFPVGKVEFLDLYPLNFMEFLNAIGEESLKTLVEGRDWPLINSFIDRYRHLLRQYYYTGGMPEVVAAFAANHDFEQVRTIQKEILRTYELDFSKHAPPAIVPRIRMLWNALPSQLSKENKKFIYRTVRPGTRAKDYELALYWLTDSGLVHKVHNVNVPQTPLKAYEDHTAFKLYTLDIGLLCAMVDIDVQKLLYGHQVFEEFKGALTEQYVLQQLISQRQSTLYYWSPSNAQSEIDFLFEFKSQIWPLEVKAEENLQAKSLKVYFEKFLPQFALRTSMSPYRNDEWITNIPLCAVTEIYHEIAERVEH